MMHSIQGMTPNDFGNLSLYLFFFLSFYHSFYLAHEGKAQYKFINYFAEFIWTRCIHITAAFKTM